MAYVKILRVSRAWPHKRYDFHVNYIYGDFFVKKCENFLDVLVFDTNYLTLRYQFDLSFSLTEIEKYLICNYYGTIQETRPRTLSEQSPQS